MRIGELAAACGVTVETLRYYEQRGLLSEPARTSAGYREYDPHTVRVVRFVRNAQDLGYTLGDISDLLRLAHGQPGDTCREIRDLTLAKIADIDVKLDRLQSMRAALGQLVDTCDPPRTDEQCPILTSIDSPH
ncbi:heavy metal-responsive transcriptional regulator [Longispora sp. K20-0274]|uniref:heavy metal-responsive transcriptional regulator n=1 Tax=Longispora sp. K20-0274 TaxID=3088255 RepID=UPI003999DD94